LEGKPMSRDKIYYDPIDTKEEMKEILDSKCRFEIVITCDLEDLLRAARHHREKDELGNMVSGEYDVQIDSYTLVGYEDGLMLLKVAGYVEECEDFPMSDDE
jgi:hypothetical protein